MPPACDSKNHGPHQPAQPKGRQKRQHPDRYSRYPFVRARCDGVNNVSPVKLTSGKQIECGGEHSHPGGHRYWVQRKLVQRQRTPRGRRQNPMSDVKDRRKAYVEALYSHNRRQWLRQGQPEEQQRHGHHKAGDRPGHANIEQFLSRVDARLDPDKRSHCANEGRRRDEKRQRGVDRVFLAEEKVSQLVRQKNCHQRSGEWNTHQQAARSLPDPFGMKQRHQLAAQRECRQPMQKVVIQLCAYDERRRHCQQQQQQVQPVGTFLAHAHREHHGPRRNLECVSDGLRRVRHLLLRFHTGCADCGQVACSCRPGRTGKGSVVPDRNKNFPHGYSIDCSSLPGLKRTALPGGMLTSAPVRGLRPMPVFLGRTVKTPNPRNSMRSPLASAVFMLSKTVSTAISALVFVTPVFVTTSLIRSSLITSGSATWSPREPLNPSAGAILPDFAISRKS